MTPTELANTLGGKLSAIVPRDAAIVVGVSGGADSVALIHLLVELNRDPTWSLRLTVAHLNHQLRGDDSDADAEFVQSLGYRLEIETIVERLDVRASAASEGRTLEEAGRDARFAFFHRCCDETESLFGATAHHADDNVETVLHRILRGTGLRGLGGIPLVRRLRPGSNVQLIRPMLTSRRSAVLHYLSDHGIAYRHDASNASSDFTRNLIRNELLPYIENKINPRAAEALLRLSDQARDADALLRADAQVALDASLASIERRRLSISIERFRDCAPAIWPSLVRCALERLGAPQRKLGSDTLHRIIALTAATAKPRDAVDLPGGLRARRRRGLLTIEHAGHHQLEIEPPCDSPRSASSSPC